MATGPKQSPVEVQTFGVVMRTGAGDDMGDRGGIGGPPRDQRRHQGIDEEQLGQGREDDPGAARERHQRAAQADDPAR